MKMKRKIIILILSIIISCGYAAHSTSPNKVLVQCETLDIPPGQSICLLGNLMFGINPNAIEACVTDDAVYIQFNQNFGNVSILLYNSIGGLVYSDTVNTDVQQLVIIPIGNVESGTYTLVLDNINGSAEGDFEHNNN